MNSEEIIEMARQAGCVEDKHYKGEVIFISNDAFKRFAKLVAEKATEEANARANASWTLMCEKMVAFEREAIIQIIKETPFSNWFQTDVIEAIRARGEQA